MPKLDLTELNRVAELSEKATQGEWIPESGYSNHASIRAERNLQRKLVADTFSVFYDEDAAFIAALVNFFRASLPALREAAKDAGEKRREILIEAAMKCRDVQYEHLGPLYENADQNVKSYHNGVAKGADICEYAIRGLADSILDAKLRGGES